MTDDELRMFKRDINLIAYASERHGYARVKAESSRASHVLRQPATGDKIVVARDGDGHWIYFSVRDERDNGSIVDFVQRRESRTLGQVRQELRGWLGTPRPAWEEPAPLRSAPRERSRVAVVAAFAAARDAETSLYLNARGIRPETLNDARFAGTWRVDARGNVLFVHRNADGVSGFEIKNRGFTGFATGGTKAVWHSVPQASDQRLVIAESAIDALSYYQLHRGSSDRARYLSTAGTPGTAQLTLVDRAMGRLPDGGLVVAAVDNDEAGAKLASRLHDLARGHAGLAFERQSPVLGKDWNDVLRRAERDYIRSLPAAVRALGFDQGRTR